MSLCPLRLWSQSLWHPEKLPLCVAVSQLFTCSNLSEKGHRRPSRCSLSRAWKAVICCCPVVIMIAYGGWKRRRAVKRKFLLCPPARTMRWRVWLRTPGPLTTLSQLLPERPGIGAHVQAFGSGALLPETPLRSSQTLSHPGPTPAGPSAASQAGGNIVVAVVTPER